MLSRRDFIKGSAVAIMALATNLFPADVQAASCQAKTAQGTYNGFIDEKGVQTWLGIPYAQPPVGKLRWQAPQPLKPSNKTFDAKKFGFSPMQDIDMNEAASLTPKNEDCLTLNIWRRGSKKNLPVMVYIPGGGFVNGGGSDPLYYGSNFAAANDVVIVTINYRLNIFGFMNFATIDSTFEDTGYLGLKDQVAALTWVKENISEFGGDPDNITIFGESAGGASTMFLMIAPAAKGLFQKAIAQSGHLMFYHTPEQSAELAEEFMELNGYKNMRELMKKSSHELYKAYERLLNKRDYKTEVDYFPTCDGKFLPLHPLRALKDGAARGIKFMAGTVADEYRYWNLYEADFTDNMADFHTYTTPIVYEGEFTNQYELYEAWKKNHADNDSYLEFANQLEFRVAQELTAEYQSAFDDVYFYLFSQSSPNEILGSCHSIELAFIFGNPKSDIEVNPDPQLVKEMQAAWFNFAATGNPNNSLIPQWQPYKVSDRQSMEMNSDAWTCQKDLNTDNLNELRHVYENYLLD